MKLVVDIPDKIYNKILQDNWNTALAGFACCEIASAIPLEKVLEDIKGELWYEGHNFTGEYQGVWVRYKDIEKAIDSHISGKE